MGWKNVKEHYRIDHIVCVNEDGICIGSGYVHNLIIISKDAKPLGNKTFTFNKGETLRRYMDEMEANLPKLKELIESPDTFSAAIPVYTYKDGFILEKYCEQLGWPNVTHDGCLMYENTFSPDKAKVVRWAKRSAESNIKGQGDIIKLLMRDVAAHEEWLGKYKAALVQLEADYPKIHPEKPNPLAT